MKRARYVVPVAVASLLFAAMVGLLVRHGLQANDGTFVYPLDDAYIHLAVSRNLALHGVWGISPSGFSGASSSPAWTLLLATVIRLAGVHVTTPLILNVLAGIALLLLAGFVLARTLPDAGVGFMTAALVFLVVVVPLPGLAMIGMEHVLHSVAMLGMISAAAWMASMPREEKLTVGAVVVLSLAALCAGALRYESCFAVVVAMVVLLWRRRVVAATSLAVAASVGPIVYGLYSHHHSPFFLPFSVMMKSAGHRGQLSLDALFASSVSPILLLLAVAFLLRKAQIASTTARSWTFGQSFLILSLGTTLLHALSGPTGWLMRYEGYLYILGIVAVALAAGEALATNRIRLSSAQRWVTAGVVVALLPAGLELLHRAHHGWSDIAVSMHDRYVEHLQQALFVGQALPKATVVANDIGFLAFYAPDIKILDPLGLGSAEPVLLQRKHGVVTPEFMQGWGEEEHAKLAILHTDFPGMQTMIPKGWVLVESWCFPHNLVFLNHVESFYAPDEATAAMLRARFAGFVSVAPEVVRYRFPEDGLTPPSPPRGENTVCPAVIRK